MGPQIYVPPKKKNGTNSSAFRHRPSNQAPRPQWTKRTCLVSGNKQRFLMLTLTLQTYGWWKKSQTTTWNLLNPVNNKIFTMSTFHGLKTVGIRRAIQWISASTYQKRVEQIILEKAPLKLFKNGPNSKPEYWSHLAAAAFLPVWVFSWVFRRSRDIVFWSLHSVGSKNHVLLYYVHVFFVDITLKCKRLI